MNVKVVLSLLCGNDGFHYFRKFIMSFCQEVEDLGANSKFLGVSKVDQHPYIVQGIGVLSFLLKRTQHYLCLHPEKL